MPLQYLGLWMFLHDIKHVSSAAPGPKILDTSSWKLGRRMPHARQDPQPKPFPRTTTKLLECSHSPLFVCLLVFKGAPTSKVILRPILTAVLTAQDGLSHCSLPQDTCITTGGCIKQKMGPRYEPSAPGSEKCPVSPF